MLKRVGIKLFKFYCHPSFQEDILGDLEEYYEWHYEEKGEKYANRRFLFDVLLLFRISLLRNHWATRKLIDTIMVKNNIKIAYRNMMRHKFYSFLNLSGLAVSMAACVFISIYVKDELSYDKHFNESEKIYRLSSYIEYADNIFNIPAAPDPMAKTMKQDFPEVIEAGRTNGNRTVLLKIDEKFFRQERITFADQEFFNVMNFPLIAGDAEHLLDQPNSTVLEESTAIKLFGKADAVGETIRYNDQVDLKVTGVIQDIPNNTHFNYDMFVTLLNDPGASQNIWLSNNYITYVKLNQANDPAAIEAKFPDFLETHIGPQIQQIMNVGFKEAVAGGGLKIEYTLQPLEDIHLYSDLDFELGETGTITYVYMFSIIGFFILLVACINFMNMSTARASVRAKEVGVRKVLGSRRKQLVNQFLTESIINSLLSFAVAIGLVYLFLPSFNELTNKALINPIFGASGLWPYLLLSALVIGLLAGVYPAFVLSSFRPIKVVKGELSQGRGSKWMRNTLVVIQFATSIFLIIASTVIYKQLDYLLTKDLGFNKDQLLIVNETQLLGNQVQAFKEELERSAAVESVSITSFIPGTNRNADFPLLRNDATSPDDGVSVQVWQVDYDYAKTFDLEMIEGRFFSEDIATDAQAVILNEMAIKRFGFTENPIGQKVKTLGGVVGNQSVTYTIVGVMKDFYFKSITESIQPHGLFIGNSVSAVNVKYNPESSDQIVQVVGDAWDKFSGGKPFDYTFLNQILGNSLANQNRVKSIFSIFAVLAIGVACLGLFGLASYITEQRKKEIGIRKVLGASTMTLLNLLFNNFTKLIIASAILATPLVWIYSKNWLSDYPDAIALSPLLFLVGIVLVLFIAWLTVGYQSLKAAKRNPIDNLRYE